MKNQEVNLDSNAKTFDELFTFTQEIGSELRSRVALTETNRSISKETIHSLSEGGLFRVMQPSRWGGHELAPHCFYAIEIELARACPSTSWVYANLAMIQWMIGLFSEQAQSDVWEKDNSILACCSFMPTAKVEPVKGGFNVSGRWGFCSGVDHCQWAVLGALLPGQDNEDGKLEQHAFLVPANEYSIVDDWDVIGLKGTGSKSIVIEKAFIPQHRLFRFKDSFNHSTPGSAINTSPLYNIPLGQIFPYGATVSSIGMLQGALDRFIETQRTRRSRMMNKTIGEQPSPQIAAAHTFADIEELKRMVDQNFKEMMEYTSSHQSIPIERRQLFRYQASRIVDRCIDSMKLLMRESGGSAIFNSNPMAQYFSDIQAARAHVAANPYGPSISLGSSLMGMDNKDYFI